MTNNDIVFVCAWCTPKDQIPRSNPTGKKISHGMCTECGKRELAKIKGMNLK